jgi:SAM-dependent methyltransferase
VAGGRAKSLLAKVDRRFAEEVRGERVVVNRLQARGFFDGLAGKRILEIGPKHGEDSALLAALDPAELVLVDLPEKSERVRAWLPGIACPTRFVEANLLFMPPEELASLGRFDLVMCLAVLYHNAEQLRLIRRLRTLCVEGGRVAIESHVLPPRPFRDSNSVRIHWPEPWGGVPTITHIPSTRAIKSWMEMAGFVDVEAPPIQRARKRAVLTGVAAGRPYASYAASGLNPEYPAGEAT